MDKRDRPVKSGEKGRDPAGSGRPAKSPREARRPGPIKLVPIPGRERAFDLLHPRCVEEAKLDYEEGLELWRAGDPEGARDALRYALQACRDNLWVHVALGRIALQEFKDPALARGHFGYAVELARPAIPDGFSGQLPRGREANRPFHEAIEGLVACLRALGKGSEAESLASFASRLAGGPPRTADQVANPQAKPRGTKGK
jgi:hypothetical protein